jgi:tRNA pseudouridine38-40 synthase
MPKLWLALFIGYNGAPFSGMQMQIESHVATIEGLLVDKLYAAGLLSTNNHTQLEKQDRWSRAARTDKGVHAVLNCISCLFNVDNKYFDEDRTLIKNKLHL